MLILTRRVDQVLHVGDARIVVTEIRRGKVTLAIEAPPGVPILREEAKEKTGDDGRANREVPDTPKPTGSD